MSRVVRFWLVLTGQAVAALLVLSLLWGSRKPAALSLPAAVILGLFVGVAVFGAVARVPGAPVVFRSRAATFGLAVFLVARAAIEEVIWRLAVTGVASARAGWLVGLATGSAGFAFAHAPAGRSAVARHSVTGAAFGTLYLATGRLAGAVAAHASYNLLVLRAAAHGRDAVA